MSEETPIETQSEETNESKPELTPEEIHQKEVNVQFKARMSAETQRDQNAARIAELEAKLNERVTPQTSVTIPDMPDQYDEDYETKLAAYVAANKAQGYSEGASSKENEFAESQRLAREQKANEDRQAEYNRLATMYQKSAVKAGASRQEVDQVGTELQNMGINSDLTARVLQDGYPIAKYLANHPQELGRINNMDAWSAAVEYEKIKVKVNPPPKLTNAPDPVETLNGGVVPETKSPHFKGATFE